MAWDTTLTPVDTTGNSTLNGVNDMADTVITQPGDQGLFGGAGLGGLILGSMFARNGMFGAGADVARAVDNNAPVLAAITQNQANSGILQLVQDVNRAGHDVATSAAATQAAVAASTLSNVTSNMQGFTALSDTIAATNANTMNGQANIVKGISDGNLATLQGQVAITDAINNVNIQTLNSHSSMLNTMANTAAIINSGLHDLGSTTQASIYQTQDQIQRAAAQQLAATHQAEISQLQSTYAISRNVTDEAEKTRALITSMEVANLNRALSDANNRVTELLGDNRTNRATSDIIINNNNNAVATANAMQQQAQQQQIANLSSGLSTALAHLNNISQVSIATGRNNTITPNAVNV